MALPKWLSVLLTVAVILGTVISMAVVFGILYSAKHPQSGELGKLIY